MIQHSNNRRAYEIVAVLITAAGKFLFMDFLGFRLPFIILVTASWLTYVIYQSKRNPGILTYWGFRVDNLRTVLMTILPFGLVCVVGCTVVGYFQNTINLTWHIIPILILYPIWGTIQQFLLIALTAGNLYDIRNERVPKGAIVLPSAILFGLVHYPFSWLMLGTFVLALFYGYVYLKERNIFALGIFHGWLGGIFFYTIVGRDPFLETFGHLLDS